MPLKVKHARVAIIATFHSRGAHSFWAVALRQPLQVIIINKKGLKSHRSLKLKMKFFFFFYY